MIILLYIILFLIIVIGGLIYFLVERNDKIRQMEEQWVRLKQSFNELDEQAKLIVKTDLELNRTQEELDKRLKGLTALQKISRSITTTLDQKEIFQKLSPALLKDIGFERYVFFMYDEQKLLTPMIGFGVSEEDQQNIARNLNRSAELISLLCNRRLLSSVQTPPDLKERLREALMCRRYILAPIASRQQLLGVVFAGNPYGAYDITEGDEELISILADQLSQAIENARLFEEVYRARQDLEKKVMERTRQLSQALEEVKRVSRMKSEFISAVSHELRTPLTSIKGYASILMTGKVGPISEPIKERLAKINKHSDNLVKLINDLLDIARIESGKVEMKLTEHDLPSIIMNVQDLLTLQMKEKNITFVADVPEDNPTLMIDAAQIERVLINLINNAIKFTPNDGIITVTVRYDVHGAKVSVSDTGIGIPPEEIPKLFQEFYRSDNIINQNIKGTGLGLALCKKIIEAHHGRISASSPPGKGATFTFTLPYRNAPESLQTRETIPSELSPPTSPEEEDTTHETRTHLDH